MISVSIFEIHLFVNACVDTFICRLMFNELNNLRNKNMTIVREILSNGAMGFSLAIWNLMRFLYSRKKQEQEYLILLI